METLGTFKHRPSPRYDFHSPPARFRMDAQRRLDGIRQEAPKHGQTYSRKRSPPFSDDMFTPIVSYAMSPMAFTISIHATWFMEISREYAIILNPVLPPH